MMRYSNAINDNAAEHIRVARLTQNREVCRRPPTPQLKKTFKRGRREALGDEKGDNGRLERQVQSGRERTHDRTSPQNAPYFTESILGGKRNYELRLS
jgi:hypothetical protein